MSCLPRYRPTLCSLLAALMAFGPAGPLLAQQPPQPQVPIQPVENPERVLRDKTLLADPAEAPNPFDLSYVLPKSAVIAAVRPGQILRAPAVEMLPYEVIQAATVQATGLDPMAAEQLVVSVEPPVQGPLRYTALAHFSQPSTVESEDLTEHTQPVEFQGQTYRQSQHPLAPSIYQPTEASILLAPDSLLRELVDDQADEPAGDLKTKFAAAAQGDDFLLMLDLELLAPYIQIGMSQADIPTELQALTRLPGLLSVAELRVNISGRGPSELIISARSEADAKEVVKIVEQVKARALAEADRVAEQLLASDDPVEQAMGRYQKRMQQHWSEWLMLRRDGDRLVIFHAEPLGEADSQTQLAYVATTGILVGLLLPAVQAAREAARRNAAMNNMKQLMLAMFNYESAHGHMPTHANYSDEGKALLSWRVHLLPYMEIDGGLALYEQFRLDEPWDSEHNRKLISKMPQIYRDPSSALPLESGKTNFVGVAGDDYFFAGTDGARQLREFTDGLSNTIAMVQLSDEAAVPWTKPVDWQPGENDPLAGLGGLHPAIFVAGMSDGSVHSVSNEITPDQWRAMLTIQGGEVINR